MTLTPSSTDRYLTEGWEQSIVFSGVELAWAGKMMAWVVLLFGLEPNVVHALLQCESFVGLLVLRDFAHRAFDSALP